VQVPGQSAGVKRLRVVFVEDDDFFARRFAETVAATPDMLLAGHATTFAEGMALLAGPPADVMLVDLGLPDGSGIDLIRAAQQVWPACEVMVSTVFADETNVIRSIEAGARGYLLKDCPPPRLVEEIRSLHAGGSPISPRIARHVLIRLAHGPAHATAAATALAPGAAASEASQLSKRELEVLNHITRGCTYDEIAKRMEVSRHTVLTFVRRIYAKLEVGSKIEAINKARSKSLIAD
jgi:DNA-binding NarL/FixJ family response regulator